MSLKEDLLQLEKEYEEFNFKVHRDFEEELDNILIKHFGKDNLKNAKLLITNISHILHEIAIENS